MAIRCYSKCRFNNGGWCDLDFVEVDENAVCMYFEPFSFGEESS